jgi:CubicO group peptidase (beta-lactamase class C family)
MMRRLPEIDQVLRNAAERGDVPGVVAMAATRKGPVYQGAYGRRSLSSGAAMTADTVFWIASMTKPITTTAAMQLVERGKLHLDRPIGETLPELAAPQVLEGFDAAGEPKLRLARRPITLRHLLTHTAGFAYDIWNPDLIRYQEKKGIPGIISCLNIALTTPLTFDPGDKWDYGISIDWVGKAVETVSGQSLEGYFQEHLFGPLGMKDTGFKLTSERRGRLVGMHARQSDGVLTAIPFEITQEPEFQMGGGGLYGTAEDYLAFTQIFLHEGRHDGVQILKPETVRAMGENHIGAINVRPLKTAMPPFSNDAEFFPGMVKKWGLGFMISTEQVPGARSAGSLTWAGLGNTYFWIDRAKGVTGVILTQVIPFADEKVLSLYNRVEAATYSAVT